MEAKCSACAVRINRIPVNLLSDAGSKQVHSLGHFESSCGVVQLFFLLALTNVNALTDCWLCCVGLVCSGVCSGCAGRDSMVPIYQERLWLYENTPELLDLRWFWSHECWKVMGWNITHVWYHERKVTQPRVQRIQSSHVVQEQQHWERWGLIVC